MAACLVDQTGTQLAAATFPSTPDGHGDLLGWVDRGGQPARAGIEGAANLGAGLARLLHDQGLDVREVPCVLTVRERRRLDEQLAACVTQLTNNGHATRTRLVDMVGIGPVVAARIMGEVGDVHWFSTGDHFASANGTAPSRRRLDALVGTG